MSARDYQKVLFRPVARNQFGKQTDASLNFLERPAATAGLLLRQLLKPVVWLDTRFDVRKLAIVLLVLAELFIQITAIVFAVLVDQILKRKASGSLAGSGWVSELLSAASRSIQPGERK